MLSHPFNGQREIHLALYAIFQRKGRGGQRALKISNTERSPSRATTAQGRAALSAAVTTPKLIGDRPTSQAEPSKGKGAPQTPAALRERGGRGERRFSQRSGLPPRISPKTVFWGGSAREGSFLQKRPRPRIFTYFSFILFAASLAAWATASPALSFSLPAMVT